MSQHPFTSCELHSDPGPIDEAPFAEASPSDTRFFGPMCVDVPSQSLGCPPVALQGGSNYGCAPGRPDVCWGRSLAAPFFAAPPDAPAIWTSIPGAYQLRPGATQ